MGWSYNMCNLQFEFLIITNFPHSIREEWSYMSFFVVIWLIESRSRWYKNHSILYAIETAFSFKFHFWSIEHCSYQQWNRGCVCTIQCSNSPTDHGFSSARFPMFHFQRSHQRIPPQHQLGIIRIIVLLVLIGWTSMWDIEWYMHMQISSQKYPKSIPHFFSNRRVNANAIQVCAVEDHLHQGVDSPQAEAGPCKGSLASCDWCGKGNGMGFD